MEKEKNNRSKKKETSNRNHRPTHQIHFLSAPINDKSNEPLSAYMSKLYSSLKPPNRHPLWREARFVFHSIFSFSLYKYISVWLEFLRPKMVNGWGALRPRTRTHIEAHHRMNNDSIFAMNQTVHILWSKLIETEIIIHNSTQILTHLFCFSRCFLWTWNGIESNVIAHIELKQNVA